MSAEDVHQAWQKHIHPEKFLTVLAGKDISTNDVAELYEKLLTPYQLTPSQKTADTEKNTLEVKNNSDQAPLTTTP